MLENGPIYACYLANAASGEQVGHLVVVTGVDIWNDRVYTNNPWGVQGYQKFEDFKNSPYGVSGLYMPLYCCYEVK